MEKSPPLEKRLPTYDNIVFDTVITGMGKIIYKSSGIDRKSIHLEPGSGVPEEGQSYVVQITRDSYPDDPKKGWLEARIIRESDSAITPGEWQQAEENVNQAEIAERRRLLAKSELYLKGDRVNERSSEQPEKELASLKPFEKRRRLRESLNKDKIKESIDRMSESFLREEEKQMEREVNELLGSESSLERKLVSFKKAGLRAALESASDLDLEKEINLETERVIFEKNQEEISRKHSVEGLKDSVDKVRSKFKRISEDKVVLLESSPEAYYALHIKELMEYKEELSRGKIIETPYVKKIEEEAMEAIAIGKYPFLHGHMGSGKTEFAKFLGRKMTGKEPILFSGSKETSKAELMGHLALQKGEMPSMNEILSLIENEIKAFDFKNPDLSMDERKENHSIIQDYVMKREETGAETYFNYGDVYKAMMEGVPLIIDEYNMIPHAVLGRLNELLKKMPGDKVDVQEEGTSFIVKEGFFFILTGNLNQDFNKDDGTYIGRQDLDPAGLRRLHPIRYDYLPQYTEQKAGDSRHLGEHAGPDNELFQIMLAKVMDKNGNMRIPKGSLEKLWYLAMGARVSQDIFARRTVNSIYNTKLPGGPSIPSSLKKINLDLGRVNHILEAWIRSGFKEDLEFYVFRYGINEATVEMDKAFLFQMFTNVYGFFKDWKSNADKVLDGSIKELVVDMPKTREVSEKEFLGPRQVVDAAFGKGPKRRRWPKSKSGKSEVKREKDANDVEERARPRYRSLKEVTLLDNEVIKKKNEAFLKRTFALWYPGNTSKIEVDQEPLLIRPQDIMYEQLKDEVDPAKFGEYSVNPETQTVVWEMLDPNKVKIEVLSGKGGKPFHEISKHIVDSYGATHHIPGFELWKWILEDYARATPAVREKYAEKYALFMDGNYHYFFGSLIRSLDGLWNVPCLRWKDSNWERDARWLGSAWASHCRVVLLEK